MIAGFTGAQAQNASSTASQPVQLGLSNALEITFTGNNSATGSTVNMAFTTASSLANGVESAAQELKVRSNKNFNVSVKSSTANFYTLLFGFWQVSSSMPASVLDVMVDDNQTGGSIGTGFSSYKDLSSTAQSLITNGTYGGDQTFSVKYKATPGFAYSANSYYITVVYTATQQ